MKSFLTVLKFALLAILLVGLAFGFIFFRVWQKNERPEITESSWTESEILLGHSSSLELTIQAPWHRTIKSASPLNHPDFILPVADKAIFTKGSLSPLGIRTWTLSVPFVATDAKTLKGLTASFPIETTKRISPNSVNLALPPLTIVIPEEIPENPSDPDSFLTEDEPKELVSSDPQTATDWEKWRWPLLAILIIPFIYLLKLSGIIKTTPPWEKALGKLDQLDPQTQPMSFYSKLTDILKQYTSERYSVRASAKTSAEFLQILRNHPRIPNEFLNDLVNFAHLADAVKFADRTPDSAEAPKSLDLIRAFVKSTTPEPTEGKKSPK